MTNTTIRIANSELHKAGFDGSRASATCEVLAMALDEGGVKARVTADSMETQIEIATAFLVDAASTLKELNLI